MHLDIIMVVYRPKIFLGLFLTLKPYFDWVVNKQNMKLCLFVYVNICVFISAYKRMIFVDQPHCVYSQAHKTIAPQRLVNVYVKSCSHCLYFWTKKSTMRQCGFCSKVAFKCVIDGLLQDSHFCCVSIWKLYLLSSLRVNQGWVSPMISRIDSIPIHRVHFRFDINQIEGFSVTISVTNFAWI